jgi:hypothetical protein
MKSARYERIDFVEFITRRDLGMRKPVDIQALAKTPDFNEVLRDFWWLYVGYGAAVEYLKASTKRGEISIPRWRDHFLGPAMILAGYRSELPPSDSRHIVFEEDDRTPLIHVNRHSEAHAKAAAKYADYASPDPILGGWNKITFGSRDRNDYLAYWSSAFADVLASLLGDRIFMSKVLSVSCHGADLIPELTSATVEAIPCELPCLDLTLKIDLIQYLSNNVWKGLLRLDFDPETEYPDYFNTRWDLSEAQR